MISEISAFAGVNALSSQCMLPCGPGLTIVFGRNGSGKTGITRLVANACFSRGKREIYPNLKSEKAKRETPKAVFKLADNTGTALPTINFVLGENHPSLKRFAVFDGQSVGIHVDEESRVNLVPASIAIFDRVAVALAGLERKVWSEQAQRKRGNPFETMFVDPTETSEVVTFCRRLSAATTDEQLLQHATFEEVDEQRLAELPALIESKKALDVSARRTQLRSDKAALEQLKSTLTNAGARFTAASATEINALLASINSQMGVVSSIGAKSFEDPRIASTGSLEWRGFLKAARAIHELERKARSGLDPDHCLLCRQRLDQRERELFAKYWEYLESESETELLRLEHERVALVDSLKAERARFPQIDESNAGAQYLALARPTYCAELRRQFDELGAVLDRWIDHVAKGENLATEGVAEVSLQELDDLIDATQTTLDALVDQTTSVATLEAERTRLQHRKNAAAVKDRALEYLAWLRWQQRMNNGVNFATAKGATTKKRTEAFLAEVAARYRSQFNAELLTLGCDFNLTMTVSGDQGRTVKQFVLDFSQDHLPGQMFSEGEKNVCAMADFLTEVQLDPNNCGIFLDDPVSSLDHERKGRIAQRLVKESLARQVVILTHDISFITKLLDGAEDCGASVVAHWIEKRDGAPGVLTPNSGPKSENLAKLRDDAKVKIATCAQMTGQQQEEAVGIALDYLRSACEALVEKYLLNRTIQRYEDQIRIHNLEEAVLDSELAARIVSLHEELSAHIPSHSRSDEMRQDGLRSENGRALLQKFELLETDLKKAQAAAKNARAGRKAAAKSEAGGWRS